MIEHHYWDLLKYVEADANKNLPYKEQIIQYIHSLWIISGSPPQDPQSYYCFNEMVPSASWFSNLLLPWLHPGSGKQNMKNWIDIQIYAWIDVFCFRLYTHLVLCRHVKLFINKGERCIKATNSCYRSFQLQNTFKSWWENFKRTEDRTRQ